MSAGDLTGDHLSDIVSGEPNGGVMPRVLLFLGAPTGFSTTPLVTIRGPEGSFFGHWIASATH